MNYVSKEKLDEPFKYRQSDASCIIYRGWAYNRNITGGVVASHVEAGGGVEATDRRQAWRRYVPRCGARETPLSLSHSQGLAPPGRPLLAVLAVYPLP